MTATWEWLQLFAAVTRAAVLAAGWPPQSCIASCRVGLDVLRSFEVVARPEAVRYDVYSPEAFLWRLAGLPWPPPAGRVLRVRGTGTFDDTRWDGHLVLILATGWLVDLSLDQASPPDQMLTLAPAVGPLPAGVTDPWHAPGAGLFVRDDGIVIHYQPMTDAPTEGWREAIDWVEHQEPRRAATVSAIRVLRTLTQLTADGLHAINSPVARQVPTDHMTLRPLDHRLADRLT